MKKKRIFLGCCAGVLGLLLLSGCGSDPAISLSCTMPPKAITDISAVDLLDISAKVNLSGTASASGSDTSYITGVLCGRLAAGFCREGFYRTKDFVWGNEKGIIGLETYILSRASGHGYPRIVTDSGMESAHLSIQFDLKIDSGYRPAYVLTPTYTDLYAIEYRTEEIFWGYGEHHRRGRIQVPYSRKISTQRLDVRTDFTQYWISAEGSLLFSLKDKKGELVYNRKFDNLRFSAANSPENRIAMPTNAQIVSLMTRDAVNAVIRDLSPFRETVRVKINKDGDRRGFLLLESLAFVEAIETYEKKKDEKRTFAEWENLGVAYEAIGDPAAARNCYEKAVDLKQHKGAFDYDRSIAEDGLDRIERIISSDQDLRVRKAKKARPQYQKSEIRQ